jgi:cytochrome b
VSAAPVPRREAWDLPTRVFHWSLASLVVFSFATGNIGGPWMTWHMRSGYAILALLLFRIAWGVVGPPHARFTSFVRGPRAALAHAREMLAGARALAAGHNPLGGWMVVAILAILFAQAATGLFADDESSHTGPLASMVSNAVVDRMSVIHEYNSWLVATLATLHVVAVVFYQWRLRIDVVGPMVVGSVQPRLALRAALIAAVAAAAVYALVVVLPR